MNDTQNHNNSPAVSIVMPVFNAGRTLMEAVDSILGQTFRNFELIICNDASTDNTADFLNGLSDKRIRIIQNSSNTGPGPSRDRMIDISKGDWIAFTDADDKWENDRLEILMSETGGSHDTVVFDDIIECHDTQKGLVPWKRLRGKYAFGGDGVSPNEVPVENFIRSKRLLIKPVIPACIIRKYNIRHVSLKFGEDTDYFLKVLSHGLKLLYIPRPLYYYRITPASATSLSTRSALLRRILEDAAEKFKHDPQAQAALREKTAMVTREENYLPFVAELKRKNYYKAFQMACHSGWIFSELNKRLWQSVCYQAHRIWHGGRTRGIK